MNSRFTTVHREGSEVDRHHLADVRISAGPRPGDRGNAGLRTMIDDAIVMIAPCPWVAHAGGNPLRDPHKHALYTPEERRRRDASPWTIVQGVLAPLQFLIFAVSLSLVLRYLYTGRGYEIATASILVKTVALYAIMITGSIWEKDVFGRWLFAPAFFWEDVFSMLVLGLQTDLSLRAAERMGDRRARRC